MTTQTISRMLPAMLDRRIRRLLAAYPAIYLACHRRHLREDEGGNALTERQASILDHLDAKRPMTLSRLAEHMGVGRSAMSIGVARLVRARYVARAKDRKDARSIGLTLTTAGARAQEQNTFLDAGLMRQMFRLMPATELERALEGVECFAKYANILLRRRKRERD
ncbi:MAG: MarR family transcriptional regulator [Terriglobales bacterium]